MLKREGMLERSMPIRLTGADYLGSLQPSQIYLFEIMQRTFCVPRVDKIPNASTTPYIMSLNNPESEITSDKWFTQMPGPVLVPTEIVSY